jgi:beta-glucosidase
VRDESRALSVIANLLEAHGRAYRVLKSEDRADADRDGNPVRVGFAKHYTQLEPLRPWNPLDRLQAYFENRVFIEAVERATIDGTIDLAIPGARPVRRNLPELKGALDWYGLNYYTRWMVRSLSPEPHVARPGSPRTDLDWEIWPEGFEQALTHAGKLGLPVLVTENGFADEHDAFRPRAIVAFVEAMHRAVSSGVRVLGYLHWSLLDNFEWSDGYKGRFGLYAVDFDRPERPRTRRASASHAPTRSRTTRAPRRLRRSAPAHRLAARRNAHGGNTHVPVLQRQAVQGRGASRRPHRLRVRTALVAQRRRLRRDAAPREPHDRERRPQLDAELLS